MGRIETQAREETRMMNKQGLCLLALLTVLLAAHAQGDCQMKFCREVKEDGNKMVKYNYKMKEPSCADMCGYTKEGDNSGDIWCLEPNGQFETKVCGEDEITTEATSDSIDATSSSVTFEDTTTTSSASTTTSEKDEATTSNSKKCKEGEEACKQ